MSRPNRSHSTCAKKLPRSKRDAQAQANWINQKYRRCDRTVKPFPCHCCGWWHIGRTPN